MLMQLGKVVFTFVRFMICLWLIVFWHLISEVVFCWYLGWLLFVSLSVLLCLQSWSLLFCSFFYCGFLFHAQLQFHASSVCHLFSTLLQLILRYERNIFVNMYILTDWRCLFISAVMLLLSLSHSMGGILNHSSMPPVGLRNRSLLWAR